MYKTNVNKDEKNVYIMRGKGFTTRTLPQKSFPPSLVHAHSISSCFRMYICSFQVFVHFLYTDKAAWTATETSVSFYLYKLYIYLLPKRGDCDKTYLQAPCSGVSPLLLLLSGSHCDSVIRYLTIGRWPSLNGIRTRASDDSITTLHQLKTKR